MRDETKYVQGARASEAGFDSVTTPIHRASTVVFPTADAFESRYDRFYEGYTYGLYGTPTSKTLEDRLSELGGAHGTVLTPSGQSALTLVLTAFLAPGDRVLVADTCYGPVRTFCDRQLQRIGVTVDYVAPTVGGEIGCLIDDRTRLILIESPGSVTMEFMDVPAIAAAAKARGVPVAMDNTWASSLLFKPHLHGVDMVVEALSKHVGGHGDLLMGAVSTTDPAMHRRLKDMTRILGLGVSADDCALALRGLQTVAVRMARSAESGLLVAKALRNRPGIEAVLHPSFENCVGHEYWRRDFSGANGVFTVVFAADARPRINAFVDALRLFRIGASWGGTQSLVAPQDPAASRSAAPWRLGRVVRFSVGLESPDDLVSDVERALLALHRASAPGSDPPLKDVQQRNSERRLQT